MTYAEQQDELADARTREAQARERGQYELAAYWAGERARLARQIIHSNVDRSEERVVREAAR